MTCSRSSTREIGVLRTLGATPRTIAAIFIAEGAAVAMLSGLAAVALSLVLVLTSLLNNAAATGLLHVAVPLAVQRVLGMSARDALAYE